MLSVENIINLNKDNIIQYQHSCLILKINNILVDSFAEVLFNTINKINNKNWYSISGIANTKHEAKMIWSNKEKNDYFIKEARKAFRNNIFSFNFEKTMIFTKGEISEVEKTLRIILDSKLFISYLNYITKNKFNLKKLHTMFLSRYKSGHFLSPHSDINNGKLAFIINLTPGWKPQYGGNLHFLNNNRTEILNTLTPAFNNLIIFEVPPQGIPHYFLTYHRRKTL